MVFLVFVSFGIFSFGAGNFSQVQNNISNYSPAPKAVLSANVLGWLGDQTVSQDQGGELAVSSVDLATVDGSALISSSMPISPGLWFEGRKEIIDYEAREGDSVSTIANDFGISAETIFGANNLNKSSAIKAGQKLVILPISGVLYRVQTGDTLSEIANTYKGSVDRILAFNELQDSNDITVGDMLVIPDGIAPVAKPIIAPQIPLANNYFILPTQGRISQGLHFYNAIDFANECGSPIYAAAQGEVIKANITTSTSRYANKGAGSYLKILHPNNTTTFYGHIMASFIKAGDAVSQGQIIALIGGRPGAPGAGNSTGCHVHFEVGGARNPFVY